MRAILTATILAATVALPAMAQDPQQAIASRITGAHAAGSTHSPSVLAQSVTGDLGQRVAQAIAGVRVSSTPRPTPPAEGRTPARSEATQVAIARAIAGPGWN